MTTQILVGVVGAPHGIRGEARLKSFTAEPTAIATYGPLRSADGRTTLTVTTARRLKDDMLVVRFAGVATREAAAALTGTRLHVDRAALPAPAEDEFYDADLIGLAVVTEDGATVGRVKALVNYGAGDILEVDRDAADTMLIAFTRSFVPTVDLPGRRIVIAAAALAEERSDEDAPGGDRIAHDDPGERR